MTCTRPSNPNRQRPERRQPDHEAGDFATIVGSNGAGKSTLFNAITGGFIADEGSITLGGDDITFAPEYQRSRVIGHLFQDPLKGTAFNMTIEENLALPTFAPGRLQHHLPTHLPQG